MTNFGTAGRIRLSLILGLCCYKLMENVRKDGIVLVLLALVVAALAWGFWYVSGNDGFNVIMIVALVALTADNVRLRRQLRASQLP